MQLLLSSETVIVLDFETTGMSPDHGDRPIEVGAVRIEGAMIVDRFQQLMNPGFTISRFIESFTGISNDLVAEAPDCETVMTRFADWIGDAPLVAHNAGFDYAFLAAEAQRCAADLPVTDALCTLELAGRLDLGLDSLSLAALAAHFGVAQARPHDALDDARVLAELLPHLLRAATGRGITLPIRAATTLPPVLLRPAA